MIPKAHSYSDQFIHKKIACISVFPPTLGGISLHAYRVCKKLEEQNNSVYYWASENWLRQFPFKFFYFLVLIYRIIKIHPQVIMYHATYLTCALYELQLITFLKKRYKYQLVIIDHDCRHLTQRSLRERNQYRKIVMAAETVVTIGSLTYDSYKLLALPATKQITCQEAFLPPIFAEKALLKKPYPPTLFSFFDTHTPLCLINATHYSIQRDKDLYGTDSTIRLVADLVKLFPSLGLIIAITDTHKSSYAQRIYSLIKTYNVAHSVYLLTNGYLIWPLLKKVDLFLRPTLSDGASISICEALFYNIPVIASNVCIRPPTVITYDVSDYTNYYLTVSHYITQRIHDGKINARPYYMHTQSAP